MNEPELRFKADDGSEFPEWKEKKLDNIAKFFSGGTPKVGCDDYYNGNINFIRSGELHSDTTELYISEKGLNNSSAKIVESGDVLYALYGATSGDVAISKIRGAINQAILCIRPFEDYDKQFLVFLLGYNKENILRKYLQGGQGNLSADIIKSLKFRIPCLKEQQKIADLFSTLDNVINSIQEEVDSWEQMKRGMMQKLFSQEVRFKADDGSEFPDWKKVELGDLIQEYNDRTTKENEDILLSAAIEGMFLNSELFGHQRGASNKGYKKVKYGTMILSTQNLHLGNANVNTRFEHGIVSPAYKTYNIVGCSIDFMAQWIKTEYAKKFFYDATTVGASACRRNVEWDTLYSQKLLIPCFEEQQKIADCLSEFDSVIEKTKQKLEAYKQLKKGLMQRMFA